LGLAIVLATVLTGCGRGTYSGPTANTGEAGVGPASERLRVGDLLKITFSGPTQPPPDHNERIPDDGFISLPLIGKVQTMGQTRVELQEAIRKRYEEGYYRTITVTIAPAERFFYVYGEVNKPDRHPYLGVLTVTDAIAAAGDFTEFANKKKVQVTRTDKTVIYVDCVKALRNPALNPEVFPGDQIFVKRSWF
jgi:polysaccharide export outer membrane protein